MRKKIILGLLCLVSSNLAFTQDTLTTKTLQEVVVTGTKFEIPVEKSGKVIFKVNQQTLQQGVSLGETLNNVAGIQIDGAFGSPGSNLSYFVRGGRNKNSLILLDGVPVTDPTGINPEFDLRFISPNHLEGIEILQGGLSTLYGSGASASVINLQTKKITKDGIKGNVGLTAGSWSSFGQNIGVSGMQGGTTFQLLLSNYKTDGFSAALDEPGNNNFDKDGFEQRNGLLKVGFDLTQKLNLQVFSGYDWFETDFDAGAFKDSDDENKQNQIRFGLSSEYTYDKGKFAIQAQYLQNDRTYTGTYNSTYNGSSVYADVSNRHDLNNKIKLLTGFTFQRLTYNEKDAIESDTTSFQVIDPYTSIFIDLPSGLNLHAGVRANNHSEYGSKFIYNINPSWFFALNNHYGIKPFASLSTSFIAPTLFQLHTPWGGNKNLKPEESKNLEYGFTFSFKDKVEFTAVHFFRDENNVIGYNTDFEYDNISDERNVKGITLSGKFIPNRIFVFQANFSWVASDDVASFIRIPARKSGANLLLNLGNEFYGSINYQYTSRRDDIYFDEFFNSNSIILNDYHLFDFTFSKTFLNDKLRIVGSLLNIFDTQFIGVYGYTTRGRNFTTGITYNF